MCRALWKEGTQGLRAASQASERLDFARDKIYSPCGPQQPWLPFLDGSAPSAFSSSEEFRAQRGRRGPWRSRRVRVEQPSGVPFGQTASRRPEPSSCLKPLSSLIQSSVHVVSQNIVFRKAILRYPFQCLDATSGATSSWSPQPQPMQHQFG